MNVAERLKTAHMSPHEVPIRDCKCLFHNNLYIRQGWPPTCSNWARVREDLNAFKKPNVVGCARARPHGEHACARPEKSGGRSRRLDLEGGPGHPEHIGRSRQPDTDDSGSVVWRAGATGVVRDLC